MEKIRAEFEKVFGKPVPNNKKNDENWIHAKINGEEKPKNENIPKELLELKETLKKEPKGVFYSGEWAISTITDKIYKY